MPFDSGGVWSLTPGYLAVTGQLILPSNHNPPLEDIALNGLSAVMVRDGRAPATGNWNMGANRLTNMANGISAQDAVTFSQLTSLTTSQGYLFGLTISNNALDAVNDIDIDIGTAASSVAAPFVSMNLASQLGKRLDSAWVVGGTPAVTLGGLDTGAVANGTYHVYLIQRSDTGVVDACFSASATAPTIGGAIPVAYDRWRRIGSIIRAGGTILGFRQYGDVFKRNSAATDRSSSSTLASSLVALTVPTGLVLRPIILLTLQVAASSNVTVALGDAAVGSANAAVQNNLNNGTGVTADVVSVDWFVTNTSAQIYGSVTFSAGTGSTIWQTWGWIDPRGRT